MLFPFWRGGNWGSDRLGNLFRVTSISSKAVNWSRSARTQLAKILKSRNLNKSNRKQVYFNGNRTVTAVAILWIFLRWLINAKSFTLIISYVPSFFSPSPTFPLPTYYPREGKIVLRVGKPGRAIVWKSRFWINHSFIKIHPY